MNHQVLAGRIAATLMLAPLVACGSPSGDADHEAEAPFGKIAVTQEIEEIVRGVVTAFNDHDANKAVRYNAPDFVQMFHGRANADNAANLANTREQLSDPAAKLTVSGGNIDVSQAGDIAIYTTNYAYDFTDPSSGKIATELGNWVMVFRRQSDGTMKIYREVISDTPPGASDSNALVT